MKREIKEGTEEKKRQINAKMKVRETKIKVDKGGS